MFQPITIKEFEELLELFELLIVNEQVSKGA